MRTCTNPSCSMRDQRVETDRSTCMACGQPLENPLGGLFDGLFGKVGSSPTVPPEVLTALREADEILSRFNAGAPVKRSEITTVLAKTSSALRTYG